MENSIVDSAAANELFQREVVDFNASCNRFNGASFFFQWFVIMAVAAFLSPKNWDGPLSTVHPHLQAAVVLGFLLGVVPGVLGLVLAKRPEIPFIIAVSQMLMIGLFVHITDGSIEAHFAYFGSLALLACYRDWRVLVVASAVAALDHLIRGWFYPFSLFGVEHRQIWRIVGHASFVIWEDVFLIRLCLVGMRQLRQTAIEQTRSHELLLSGREGAGVLLETSEALHEVSGVMTANAAELIKDTTNSLADARTASGQMNLIASRAAEMDAAVKKISDGVLETAERASESDATATSALQELSQLVQASQQITEVLDTVQELVFQTNLLSVNASIEAANAGPAGASFAVVAAEVRSLAERSRESADGIKNKVAAIQEHVNSVAERLTKIGASVSEISALTKSISSSTQQQVLVAADINLTTSEANLSTQRLLQALDGVHQLSGTASQCADKTFELAEHVRTLSKKTAVSMG